MLVALIQILYLAAQLLIYLIIANFILSLLVAFNVVSRSNQFVDGLLRAFDALLDPVLRPIRKFMPDTGMIDFSPIILIFGIQALIIILSQIAASAPV